MSTFKIRILDTLIMSESANSTPSDKATAQIPANANIDDLSKKDIVYEIFGDVGELISGTFCLFGVLLID